MQTNPLATNRALSQIANPSIAARRNAAVAKPEAFAPRARGADTVILSRQALAQSRPANAQPLPATNGAKNVPVGPPLTANTDSTGAPAGAPITYGQNTLDLIREHFGARKEDEGYNFEADADGNGVVDFKDMTHVLANWGQTRS